MHPLDLAADLNTGSIAFVHGFTGHPVRTWTHQKGHHPQNIGDDGDDTKPEPPFKIRKVATLFSSSRQGRGDQVTPVFGPLYWPRDLLPIAIPSGRILTYGYDTNLRHVFGPPLNKATVYDIAGDFLVALEAERRASPARPILFVAHSLGGIVVKEMLRRASGYQTRYPHLYNVFNSTTGVVFFGTPHGGADPRGFIQHVAETIIRGLGFSVNEQVVNTLLPSAERLKELKDEFGPMVCERNWMVHSFQEGLGIKFLSGRKVGSYMSILVVVILFMFPDTHSGR